MSKLEVLRSIYESWSVIKVSINNSGWKATKKLDLKTRNKRDAPQWKVHDEILYLWKGLTSREILYRCNEILMPICNNFHSEAEPMIGDDKKSVEGTRIGELT